MDIFSVPAPYEAESFRSGSFIFSFMSLLADNICLLYYRTKKNARENVIIVLEGLAQAGGPSRNNFSAEKYMYLIK